MTTTELIALLKKYEYGGATGRSREVYIAIGERIYETVVKDIDTGDGLFTELFINLSAQPEQWIPVTEKLPDISKSVLICDIDGDIYLGHRTRWGDYYPDFCDDRIKCVIAWMPLPEPWKESAV